LLPFLPCLSAVKGGVGKAKADYRADADLNFFVNRMFAGSFRPYNDLPFRRVFEPNLIFWIERKAPTMAHIVTQPCFGCRYTDCVVVCPVECFYEGEKMLYIHPDECIDCEACVPECPVEAIFHQDNVPEEWTSYVELNAEMAPQCEVITQKKKPLADS
jgi:ferredoxin